MDNQDFRKYGGLISHLPLSYSVMLIASLSLVAIPSYQRYLMLESRKGQYFFNSNIEVYIIIVLGFKDTIFTLSKFNNINLCLLKRVIKRRVTSSSTF